MHRLDLTLPTPAENLACDEALLHWAEAAPGREALRFWAPQTHFVVVGYGNKVAQEVNVEACRDLGIPILRRCSGGGAVLQGPGCLNYSLVLAVDARPTIGSVSGANRVIMETNRAALESLLTACRDTPPGVVADASQRETLQENEGQRAPTPVTGDAANGRPGPRVRVQGHTDLAVGDFKCSGNAQRRLKRCVLFHGTILLGLDLSLVGRCLRHPSREPDYRQGRGHGEFLMNLAVSRREVQQALIEAWSAARLLVAWPEEDTALLARERYSRVEWNLRR